jgi:hypothetical protein
LTARRPKPTITQSASPGSRNTRLNLIRLHGVPATNASLHAEIIPSTPVNTNTPSADHDPPPPLAPTRMSWARLLKRVFDIDIAKCPHSGGTLKSIAAIENHAVIAKILANLGLSARAPPRSPAFDRLQYGLISAANPLPSGSLSRQPPLPLHSPERRSGLQLLM